MTSEGYGFGHADKIARSLETLLRSHGITILPGSQLEQAALSVLDILYKRDDQTHDREDIRPLFRDLIGLTELGGLILSVKDHPDFRCTLKHLALLNRGKALQNVPSPQRDQATNKVFELWAACLAMHSGSAVELDDPVHSPGDNPDVLVTIDGVRWGIACKVVHSLHPESFVQNLQKGLDQIDASPADVGVVLFNLKNIIKHDEYWTVTNEAEWKAGAEPLFGVFLDKTAPFNLLVRETREMGRALTEHVGKPYLAGLFNNRRSVPGFLLWSHTVAGVKLPRGPAASSVRVMNLQEQREITGFQRAALDRLHDAAYADQPRN